MMWFPYGGWWMVFGTVWMVIFWGGIIALIVWGITRWTRGESRHRREPLEIAKERYARGEISKEEFEHLKKDLSGL